MDETTSITKWKQSIIRKVIIYPGDNTSATYGAVINIEVNSSIKELTDSAKVSIPKKFYFEKNSISVSKPINGNPPLIMRGDKIKIELGYYDGSGYGGLKEVFNGYITTIVDNAIITLECEDDMFILKHIPVTYPSERQHITHDKNGVLLKKDHWEINKSYTLNQMVAAYMEPFGIPFINFLPDLSMGTIPWTQIDFCRVLNELRNGKAGVSVYSYFTDPQSALDLYNQEDKKGNKPGVGKETSLSEAVTKGLQVLVIGYLSNSLKNPNPPVFGFEYNITEDGNLKWQNKKDIDLTIIVKSKQTNLSTKSRDYFTEIGVGSGYNSVTGKVNPNEAFGKIQSHILANDIKDTAEMIKLGNDILINWKYDGWRGNFETMGEPLVNHGDDCVLYSLKFPYKSGLYQVVGVTRAFGSGGYRQRIELGISTTSFTQDMALQAAEDRNYRYV